MPARLGRGRPNRPYVARPPIPYPWILGGSAATASSAAGDLTLVSTFGGDAPASSSAVGLVGLVLVFGGVAPASSSAGSFALAIVGPNLAELALAALVDAETVILRRVDLYEHDGETLYLEDVDAVEWAVQVSDGAGPRRTLTAVLHAEDGGLMPNDAGFGFDKVVKVWRGVVLAARDGAEYWWPIGTFDVEPLTSQHFPTDTISMAGADFAARLNRASYSTVTTFAAGQSPEAVIEAIARYGGITRFRIESTFRVLSRDYTLEPDVYLWDAIQQACTDSGVEAYFDAAGYLTVRVVRNATERSTEYAFAGGPGGNLVGMTVERTRANLHNHWTARGESSSSDTPPVSAFAENTEPTSPVSIGRIGRQSAPPYVSSAITTEEEARIVAEARRAEGAIRAYRATVTGIVAPHLDAGSVVAVTDPNPDPGAEPVARWRLESFTIGSALGATDYTVHRAEYVGARTV